MFVKLPRHLIDFAEASVRFLRERNVGVKITYEKEIDIGDKWKPTYWFATRDGRLVAVEVSDKLFPEILRISYSQIIHANKPIMVYQVVPLDVYKADKDEDVINELVKTGIAIISVDSRGRVTLQKSCVALAQHISEEELSKALQKTCAALKTCFFRCHQSYNTNEVQGLQAAGQVIEGIVENYVAHAVKNAWATKKSLGRKISDKIDNLYTLSQCRSVRAALASARSFLARYRNLSSHPVKSLPEAKERIDLCRTGFLDSISIAKVLWDAAKSNGIKVIIR